MTLTVYEDLEQGSPEWLQARAGIVTASTVGKLLTSAGKVANNDTSRALTETLVAERLTGNVEYVHPTADMQRGTALEPFARDIYATHYAPVTEIGFARYDEGTYTIGASPDGLVGEDGGIEIKSPRAKTHLRTILEDQVPPMYLPQINACMAVLNRDYWDFVSYHPGLPLYVKRVHRSWGWDERIGEAVQQFTDNANALIDQFQRNTRGLPKTEHFDPYNEEEEVIFG